MSRPKPFKVWPGGGEFAIEVRCNGHWAFDQSVADRAGADTIALHLASDHKCQARVRDIQGMVVFTANPDGSFINLCPTDPYDDGGCS